MTDLLGESEGFHSKLSSPLLSHQSAQTQFRLTTMSRTGDADTDEN